MMETNDVTEPDQSLPEQGWSDTSAGGLVHNPTRTQIYQTSAMRSRRRRILHETRRMIAERGLDGFSVRELCRNADIAQRTLYNAFQSKDRLVAIAIREAYEEVNSCLHYRTSPDTIEGIVDRLIAVNMRNFKARNYTRAVVSLYFSPSIDQDVWDSLRAMVFLNLNQWLDRIEREAWLAPWAKKEKVAGDIANLEYSIIADWAHGRIPDKDYVPQLIVGVLSYAAGVTRGQAQRDVLAMLDGIGQTGELPEQALPIYRPRATNRE